MASAAGAIIVLRVAGAVDLLTLPALHTALAASLDSQPGYLVVDLAELTFCSVRGLTLFALFGRTTAERGTGYALSGIPPQISRIWTMLGDGDLPVRYRTAAAAVTAISSHQAAARTGTIDGTTTRPNRWASHAITASEAAAAKL